MYLGIDFFFILHYIDAYLGVDESFKSEIERLMYKIKIYKDNEDHYVKEIQDLKTQIDEVQEKYKKKKKGTQLAKS